MIPRLRFSMICLLAILFSLTGSSCVLAQVKERRLALVIGNADYQYSGKLNNTVNDADLMAATLHDLGFDVIKKNNASKVQMEQTILDFSRELGKYNVALFFYAGHGIQLDGTNYLLPVDARLEDRLAAQFEAVDVAKLVSQFERYPNNINIVILDACRNNPFKSWSRGGESGFKAIPAPSGTLIAFATGEGATASDGAKKNGLYTAHLVEQMKVAQRIEDVFIQTRIGVRAESKNQQSPQEWSQLTGKFFFASQAKAADSLSNGQGNKTPSEAATVSRGSAGGATEFDIRNRVADLLNSGRTVIEVLDSNIPLRYFYGVEYQGGLIVDIDEKTNTGIVVSKVDLARGSKVTLAEARTLCDAFNSGGYSDWALPSKALLELIYTNVAKINYGDFSSGVYWSNSTSGYSHAWGKSFGSGASYDFDITSQQFVRAVRTFKLK